MAFHSCAHPDSEDPWRERSPAYKLVCSPGRHTGILLVTCYTGNYRHNGSHRRSSSVLEVESKMEEERKGNAESVCLNKDGVQAGGLSSWGSLWWLLSAQSSWWLWDLIPTHQPYLEDTFWSIFPEHLQVNPWFYFLWQSPEWPSNTNDVLCCPVPLSKVSVTTHVMSLHVT